MVKLVVNFNQVQKRPDLNASKGQQKFIPRTGLFGHRLKLSRRLVVLILTIVKINSDHDLVRLTMKLKLRRKKNNFGITVQDLNSIKFNTLQCRGQSQWRIPWLTAWLILTCDRKDRYGSGPVLYANMQITPRSAMC